MAGMGNSGFFLHRLVGPLIPGMVVGVMQQRIRMQISCFFFRPFAIRGVGSLAFFWFRNLRYEALI